MIGGRSISCEIALRWMWFDIYFENTRPWYISPYSETRPQWVKRVHPSLQMTQNHYIDVIMITMASQITSLTVVYSTVNSDADERKHQSSASLAFLWGIHWDRWIPRTKGQLRGKCFHLMTSSWCCYLQHVKQDEGLLCCVTYRHY